MASGLVISRQLIDLAPDNARYHVGHAVLLAQMNRIDAALAAIRQAIKLDPTNAAALHLQRQVRGMKNR